MTDAAAGKPIQAIRIARGALSAELLSIGASLRRLEVPDRAGEVANVVLGYRDLADYRGAPRYHGCIAGRYANRIGGAHFVLGGKEYRLAANDGDNSLHGGPLGFDQQDWEVVDRHADSVTFRHVSPSGRNGFPGTLVAEARYALNDDGLDILLRATADAPTIVNLTNHAYFNLASEASGASILGHVLQIAATRTTPVDAAMIPTGALADVAGTPFDFRTPKPVGRDIDAADEQLAIGRGYDHNFAVDGTPGTLRRMATLYDPGSGRVLDLHSTAPGLQFYSGNHLAGGAPGTSGRLYVPRDGLCLEPQAFPDTPNKPQFGRARLDPGDTYVHAIKLRFRVADDLGDAFPADR